MNRAEWEKKFGGGRKIRITRWTEDSARIDWCIFKGWRTEGDFFDCVTSTGRNNFFYRGVEEWEIVEEPESTIQEKSIEDFPEVEVRNKCQSLHRYETGRWTYMRPIKPVDVEDLKRRARLV